MGGRETQRQTDGRQRQTEREGDKQTVIHKFRYRRPCTETRATINPHSGLPGMPEKRKKLKQIII